MMRQLDVRFDVCRHGAKITELYAIDNPRMIMNATSPIKTSLQGSFVVNDKIDYLTDEIRPVLIINGQEHHCGVFLPVTVFENHDENDAKSVQMSAYDRCWLVQAEKTEIILHINSGAKYLDVIKSLLEHCGVYLLIETPSSATIATPREDWDVGTDYLTIINQLLSEINYKQLWFNSDGYAMLEPQLTPTADNIQQRLDASKEDAHLLIPRSKGSDIYNKPNVFICICSNPDLAAPLVAVGVNDNIQSPLSVQRRGRRISTVIKVDNIASQSALQTYANRKVLDSMAGADTITIHTALRPGHGVEDVIALKYGDITGICIETAWTMELATGGDMSHTLGKVEYLYG